MCTYYAHTHPCGHTVTVLAGQCSAAALTRRPCGKGSICATVKVEEVCGKCPAEAAVVPRNVIESVRKGRGVR